MFSEISFCPGERATVRSVEELHRGLAAELGSPHTVAIREGGSSIELVEFGISLSLVFDDKGDLLVATAALPSNVDFGHVSELCKAFLSLGWTF